jgi:hypothetical protein
LQDSLAAGGLRHGGELVIDGQGSFNTPLAVYLVSEACTYSQNSPLCTIAAPPSRVETLS